MNENLDKIVEQLCKNTGQSEEFKINFLNKLYRNQEICEEFTYYMKHKNFLLNARVEDCTVIDVLVWQMDHFKARLDCDNHDTKHNESTMILLAFDTFLTMKEEPGRYLMKMKTETGSDYPGKFE